MVESPDETGGGGVAMIRARGLGRRFGRVPALEAVDLDVPEGAFYLLVGPNGAGKTTLLRILADLVAPGSGRAEVAGMDPVAQGAQVRAAVGYVPEDRHWPFARMSVEAFLHHHGVYRTTWDVGYAEDLRSRLGLDADRRVGTLSKGEMRRLQLVAALAFRPPVLLLDEPTDGLSFFVALLLPGLVWQGLSPAERGPFHAMPVERGVHGGLRVVAGGVVFLALVAILLGAGAILGAGGAPSGGLGPGDWAMVLGSLAFLYLIASLAALLTRNGPLALLLVGVAFYLFVGPAIFVLATVIEIGVPIALMEATVMGAFSPIRAVFAGALALGGGPTPESGLHLEGLLFWLVVAGVLVVPAAQKHPTRG